MDEEWSIIQYSVKDELPGKYVAYQSRLGLQMDVFMKAVTDL